MLQLWTIAQFYYHLSCFFITHSLTYYLPSFILFCLLLILFRFPLYYLFCFLSQFVERKVEPKRSRSLFPWAAAIFASDDDGDVEAADTIVDRSYGISTTGGKKFREYNNDTLESSNSLSSWLFSKTPPVEEDDDEEEEEEK
jgi:hypothetical protein